MGATAALSLSLWVCVCLRRGQKLHLLYPPPAGDHCCLRLADSGFIFAGDAVNSLFCKQSLFAIL